MRENIKFYEILFQVIIHFYSSFSVLLFSIIVFRIRIFPAGWPSQNCFPPPSFLVHWTPKPLNNSSQIGLSNSGLNAAVFFFRFYSKIFLFVNCSQFQAESWKLDEKKFQDAVQEFTHRSHLQVPSHAQFNTTLTSLLSELRKGWKINQSKILN